MQWRMHKYIGGHSLWSGSDVILFNFYIIYIIILSMSLIPGQINIGVLNQVQGARQGTPAGTVDGNGIPLNSVAIARILSETRPLNP